MKNESLRIGVCFDTVKEIVTGEKVRNWLLAGVLLALMNVDSLSNTCPFCKRSFESGRGLLNHLMRSECRNELVKVCLKASEMEGIIVGRHSWKTGKKVKLYLKNGDSILCNHGDYKCVANGIRKYVQV